ncbi:hypothetical protein IFM89_036318 [Coptis chinensis]|uniref:Pentatricopeptide repeat-containing protein n=1 Tax=Coptis chinensis TaxID=261450 RepID=A0A835IJ49_9MAGN|nr:hypothetical protein IFM89_036318 [Coptis chinensis]
MTKEAHLVYLKAKEKKKRLPHFSIKLLVSSLCKENDTVKLALDLLDDFNESGRKYAIKHYSGVIRGLLRIKDIEAAKTLLFKMIDEGPPPGNAVFNSVINVLCKAGRMEEARDLVKVMENRGLRPDVYTYCVIMSGYAKKGLMEEAQNVFSEAKNTHSILSPVTYHVLTRGMCQKRQYSIHGEETKQLQPRPQVMDWAESGVQDKVGMP